MVCRAKVGLDADGFAVRRRGLVQLALRPMKSPTPSPASSSSFMSGSRSRNTAARTAPLRGSVIGYRQSNEQEDF